MLEDRNLLFGAVIVDLELVLVDGTDNLAVQRFDGGDDVDQIDVGAEDGGLLGQEDAGAECSRQPAIA